MLLQGQGLPPKAFVGIHGINGDFKETLAASAKEATIGSQLDILSG